MTRRRVYRSLGSTELSASLKNGLSNGTVVLNPGTVVRGTYWFALGIPCFPYVRGRSGDA